MGERCLLRACVKAGQPASARRACFRSLPARPERGGAAAARVGGGGGGGGFRAARVALPPGPAAASPGARPPSNDPNEHTHTRESGRGEGQAAGSQWERETRPQEEGKREESARRSPTWLLHN